MADTSNESGNWLPAPDAEWLVTNGLGGYASGTVGGVPTRRYHGWLIAALPRPLGRTILLNAVQEQVRGWGLDSEHPVPLDHYLAGFRLDLGLPVWTYRLPDRVIEKRVVVPHLQNTSFLMYRMTEGKEPIELRLRPAVHFRLADGAVDTPHPMPYVLTVAGERFELSANGFPPLRLTLNGPQGAFTLDALSGDEILYQVEASRGYESTGDLWSPGFFHVSLASGTQVALIASTESWDVLGSLTPDEAILAERTRRSRLLRLAPEAARQGVASDLVLAADQFIIIPAGRAEDSARAHAAGEEIRTVIAGYHWFTDWGRDTMISLEGLTLSTGRTAEAGYILRTFAYYVRDGLIPNMFPEGQVQGLYHTADASLWFFHALERYYRTTLDRPTLELILPRMLSILEYHLKGTRFGIGVDPADGLLRQGAEGYQLTWMDAKVGDWVVTPRRGKAVEINALWYNALRLAAGWLRELRGHAAESEARRLDELAEQSQASFNARFWYESGGYLYDVIDGEFGNDPACRPNQVFAVSLDHPVLRPDRWAPAVEVVRRKLLTPFGLRSLSSEHPDYKTRYFGDLRARDAAYHQGTVWAWLIGPFVDAWLRVHPEDRAGARRMLEGIIPEFRQAGIGTLSEIFDAEAPYTPRGCMAQAWSVAEMLRAWLKTEPGS